MIKDKYYKYRTTLNIIRKDLKDKFPLPIHKKINLWRKGFLAEKYTLYQFDKNDSKNYLSDYNTSMARWINEPFNELLTNKLIFSEFVGQYIKVPFTYGIFVNGRFKAKTNFNLEGLLNDLDTFVVKTVTGGGGKGVYIVSKSHRNMFTLNNKETYSKEELLGFFKTLNNFIFTEFITPSDFTNSLNPASVNTMRILTLIDPDSGEPFMAAASQRIGVLASAPQDNFTKGGLSAAINIETGQLSDATSHPKDKVHRRVTHHPDSKFQISDVVIPDWQSIKDEILKAAGNLPMLKCIGWDFVLSDKGLVAIEGNHHPDPDVLQAHAPLLKDDRIVKFYKHHNII